MKAKRAKIHLTNNLVVDGWLYQGFYLMSGTDATKILSKARNSLLDWLKSKSAQSLSDKDKTMLEVPDPEGKGSRITLYTIECVRQYWRYWDRRGNFMAGVLIDILTADSLERLYDVAFQGKQKSEQEYQEHRDELLEKLIESRNICKVAHGGFQRTCLQFHYRANHVHDYLTLKISGMDARLARELEMILSGNPDVGLDHYQPAHDLALRQLAQAKRTFTWIRNTDLTWTERVDRAVEAAQQKIKM